MKEHQDDGDIEKEKEETKIESENVAKLMCIDLDYVLTNELGQFGLFQIRIIILLLIAIILYGTVQDFIFSAAATPHR